MNILEKIDKYLTEEGPKFWNTLSDVVNRKWGSHVHKELTIMLRQSKEPGKHYMMMANTFNELPKEFVNIVKKIKLEAGESINEKERKITLSDEHWKQVFRNIKKAK